MNTQTFIYDWRWIDDKLHIYSCMEDGKTICTKVIDFYCGLYIETNKKNKNIQVTHEHLQKILHPVEAELVKQKKLYFYNPNPVGMLFYRFKNRKSFYSITSQIRKLGHSTHEAKISPELQFTALTHLPMAGWMSCPVNISETTNRICRKDVKPIQDRTFIPGVCVMAFDIECYSSVEKTFPQAKRREDEIFQISCVVWITGSKIKESILITRGEPQPITLEGNEKVLIYSCINEVEILSTWCRLIREKKCIVITGWNIMGFDFPYIIDRLSIYYPTVYEQDFLCSGLMNNRQCSIIDTNWSSSAYGAQSLRYPDWPGRICIDLMLFAKREIKAENYKLNTIAGQYVETHKDPVTPEDLFRAFREEILDADAKTDYSQIGITGKYCVMDSILVYKLFVKLDLWTGCVEMSSICNVPISFLYSRGQQQKVFGNIYKHCKKNGIVIDRDSYEWNSEDRYKGAYVREPIPGFYNHVVPFDFKSLYPTLIVAYNIDYTTLVLDDSIPDSECHVIEWDEDIEYNTYICAVCEQRVLNNRTGPRKFQHKSIFPMQVECPNCSSLMKIRWTYAIKDPLAKVSKDKIAFNRTIQSKHYKFRFIKKHIGILPCIEKSLLDARSQVRNKIKTEPDPIIRDILNKRQLAYKVCANSVYGALGVREGVIPCMPAAMCITALGRYQVSRAADLLRDKYKLQIIYGDTDSVYVCFPDKDEQKANSGKTESIWERATLIEEDILEKKFFPEPMVLEFEKEIYNPFMILSKKRYMWRTQGNTKIGSKGVVLVRRGGSLFVQTLYRSVIEGLFNHEPKYVILDKIVEYLNDCERGLLDLTLYTMSKRLKSLDLYETNPPHKVLAMRLKKEGRPVAAGARMEYLVTDNGGKNIGDRIETIEDFIHSKRQKIDFLYYIDLASNPIDEALCVGLNIEPNFLSKQLEQRRARRKIGRLLTKLKMYNIDFKK